MVTSVDATPEPLESTPARAPVNFLLVLWQRKWLVAFGLAVGLVVGGIVASRAQPAYRSSAQVLVIKKRADVVPGTADTPQPYDDYLSLHAVLLKSPAVLQKAVAKGGLAQLPTFAGKGNPVQTLATSLTVNTDAGSHHMLELSYQGPVADDTATVLQAVIDSYRDFVGATYRDVSKETEELIKKAQGVLKTELEDKERDYQKFRESNPNLLTFKTREGLTMRQMRIEELMAKRTELALRRADAEASLRVAEQGSGGGTPAPRTRPATAGTRAAAQAADDGGHDVLEALLAREKELLEDYGEDHPKVHAVRSRIALERKLLTEAPVTAAKAELAQIDQSEVELKSLLDKELQDGKEARHDELTDDRYQADLDRLKQLYGVTIRRLEEINLVRDFGGYSTQVISPPEAGVAVKPTLYRDLMLAAFLGLTCGIGLAYLADARDKSFRTAEEIRRRLGLPLMGHIPFDAVPKGALPSANGQPHPAPVLCVYHRPTSPNAEAYRGLRTALFFATQAEGQKVIQITSPRKGDGKTTLLTNLGVSIAQSGKRVVLVDADFRRPRLDRLFGLTSAEGLTAVLAGEADPAALIHETGVPGLSVLPCGQRPPNPAELLTSPAFGKVLAELREEYDYVLIDTPPLLAVTDPCVVAGQVEGVLLAIRVARNGRPAAERAKEMLGGLGAPVLGVVVNGIGQDATKNGYRYYAYHDYHYHDGYQEEAEAEADGTAKPR